MASHAAKHLASATPKIEVEQEATTASSPRPSTATTTNRRPLLVSDLGWSQGEAAETYFRLRQFEEDWSTPEMDAYDDL